MITPGADNEVLLEIVEGNIAVVTLNRPAVRNAVNAAMTLKLDAIVKRIEADDEIRVAILASSNARAFCAGADLAEVAQGNGPKLRTIDGGFAGFTDALKSKPWIAAVRGFVFAGGFELALACDMLVASTDAVFGVPEVRRGLVAGAGGLYRLPRVVPRSISIEMVATGEPIDAARAASLGMINHVVASEAVLDKAVELARMIANNAPVAVRESLKVVRRATEHSDDELRKLSQAASDLTMATDDCKEGANAFLEKRAPHWVGH